MYKNFFGLKELPFNFSPDPRYLYWTPAAQEALSSLTYGIESRKGFILLTGEVGTGKTTLLNGLLDWLRSRCACHGPRRSLSAMFRICSRCTTTTL